jgi:hypothetical protein
MDIPQEKQSQISFTREDMERSTTQESLLATTVSLKVNLANMVLLQSKISSMKSKLLDLISRKQTTSSGHSNLAPQRKVSPKRDTHITTVVFGETERPKLTNSSRE